MLKENFEDYHFLDGCFLLLTGLFFWAGSFWFWEVSENVPYLVIGNFEFKSFLFFSLGLIYIGFGIKTVFKKVKMLFS